MVRTRSPTELRQASGPHPQNHFRVQGRWTPRWPVLDGRVPTLLEVGRDCPPLLNRSRPSRAECVRLVPSALVTSQAGRAQGLAVSSLRSRHSPLEGKPSVTSMSWISYLVGRFSGVHRWPVLGVPRGHCPLPAPMGSTALRRVAATVREANREIMNRKPPVILMPRGFPDAKGQHPLL